MDPNQTFYIRDTDGACFYVDTLDEALKIFTSSRGYRLTLKTDDVEVIFRRNSDPEPALKGLDDTWYKGDVTVRKPIF